MIWKILLKIITMITVLAMPLPPKACHVVGRDDVLLGGQVCIPGFQDAISEFLGSLS